MNLIAFIALLALSITVSAGKECADKDKDKCKDLTPASCAQRSHSDDKCLLSCRMCKKGGKVFDQSPSCVSWVQIRGCGGNIPGMMPNQYSYSSTQIYTRCPYTCAGFGQQQQQQQQSGQYSYGNNMQNPYGGQYTNNFGQAMNGGYFSGAVQGTMPGAMPGTMPGAMPSAMPGAMPGTSLGAAPGATPGAMPGGTTGAATTAPAGGIFQKKHKLEKNSKKHHSKKSKH